MNAPLRGRRALLRDVPLRLSHGVGAAAIAFAVPPWGEGIHKTNTVFALARVSLHSPGFGLHALLKSTQYTQTHAAFPMLRSTRIRPHCMAAHRCSRGLMGLMMNFAIGSRGAQAPAAEYEVLVVGEHEQDVWAVLARRPRGRRRGPGAHARRGRRQHAPRRLAVAGAQLSGARRPLRSVEERARGGAEARLRRPACAGRLGLAGRTAGGRVLDLPVADGVLRIVEALVRHDAAGLWAL